MRHFQVAAKRGLLALTIVFLPLMMAANAQAGDCIPTPTVSTATEHKPSRDTIPNGNNLTRPSGKAVVANGQKLRFQGRVLDSKCRPIAGAVIELWQANQDGIYQVADRAALSNPYAVFAGAGRATTDNTGSFAFYTIFPGASLEQKGKRAPHLHIHLSHPGVTSLTTELFFFNEQRNGDDPVYNALSPSQRQAVTLRIAPQANGELIADSVLVLNGSVPYVQY